MDTGLHIWLGQGRDRVRHPECRKPAGGGHPDIERVTKFDPGRRNQKCGQTTTLGALCAWQENGNDAEASPVSLTRRSMAARISSFCQGPNPLGPTNTAQVSDFARASSIAGCHGSPGIRCHLSSHTCRPCFASRRPNSSTAGLSAVLWERNTLYRRFEPDFRQNPRFGRSWVIGLFLHRPTERLLPRSDAIVSHKDCQFVHYRRGFLEVRPDYINSYSLKDSRETCQGAKF